jgi:antitoxin component of MazEF toxin-antitoxin module
MERSEIVFAGIRTVQRKGDSYAITLPKAELEEELEGAIEEEIEGQGVRVRLREDGSFEASLPISGD